MKVIQPIQEACDYAVEKIVSQGGRCFQNGDCMYGVESNSDVHCAVGWLLPWGEAKDLDDYFIDMIDGVVALKKYWPREHAALVPEILKTEQGVETLKLLQNFHDYETAIERRMHRDQLKELGVDTSAPQWQQWVDMAE
jgi:hypothetical protein